MLPAGRMSTIHCLMIPLKKDILLLPNAAIAEVVAYRNIDTIDDSPAWLLGHLNWRENMVPVMSFESATGDEAGITSNRSSRVAILNTLNGNSKLPYIGLLTQGIPHLQVVQSQGVAPADAVDDNELIRERVMVNGVAAVIPDIDELEHQLLSAFS